ncbi:MAG: hypothetical protein KC486_08700 [Myxococcales bacterium]|nr:hypothetical protein [Myxococcales bacterium]
MPRSSLISRLLAATLVVGGLAGPTGCAGRWTRPPYSVGDKPAAESLLDAAAPELEGLRVSQAKIRLNRSIAGNLMLIAQSPERFVGQIQISGKELVSLAFHEEGYALRYVSGEGLPMGFYSGPPSSCAIAQLLGVAMAPREVIALILGGAPVIDGPYEIVSQRWERKTGHEVVRLRSATLEEELRFAWIDGRWWPAGASVYHRLGERDRAWLWTVLHESPHSVDGHTMPGKTIITRPDGRRKQKVTISYRAQEPNPEFLKQEAAVGDTDGWDDGGGWEDEGGWEDGEGSEGGDDGWDDAESAGEAGTVEGGEDATPADANASATTDGAPPADGAATQPATPKLEPKPKPKPAPSKPAIPQHFILTGEGLPIRGHLCRGH